MLKKINLIQISFLSARIKLATANCLAPANGLDYIILDSGIDWLCPYAIPF